jgi:hypothetical protein
MNFVKHPNHTLYMGAPREWNEERDGPCGALSIQDKRRAAIPSMESCWEPEGFEGHLLAMGFADIRLGIISNVHPPVYMTVYPKGGITQKMRLAAIKKAAQDLIDYAHDCNILLTIDDTVADVNDMQPGAGG